MMASLSSDILTAIRCEDTPDLVSTGSSHSWSGLDVFSTNITYSCPPGQAFQGVGETRLVSTCKYQGSGDSRPTWTYNSERSLPDCTGLVPLSCLVITL